MRAEDAMGHSPYSLRCPEGHVSLEHRSRLDRVRCKACGVIYDRAELVDLTQSGD